MSADVPTIYLVHGDDLVSIARFLAEIEAKMGDPAMAEFNTSRLDGRDVDIDSLPSVVNALPFAVKRRMVVLSNPTARLTTPAAREKFLSILEKTPETTALLLVEYQPLTNERDRRNNKLHWLEKWAEENQDKVYLRELSLPRGAGMVRWVQDQAVVMGGQFSNQAANELVSLIGEDPRLIEMEIEKLLAYVNYSRQVEVDDVQALTADVAEGNIFTLVDAMGNRDSKTAMGMLVRLLEEQDALSIFGMVTRQFRLLLQTRELMDLNMSPAEIASRMKILPFIASKLSNQSGKFSTADLKDVYRHLLNLDEAMKTGKMSGELALQTLVVELAA